MQFLHAGLTGSGERIPRRFSDSLIRWIPLFYAETATPLGIKAASLTITILSVYLSSGSEPCFASSFPPKPKAISAPHNQPPRQGNPCPTPTEPAFVLRISRLRHVPTNPKSIPA